MAKVVAADTARVFSPIGDFKPGTIVEGRNGGLYLVSEAREAVSLKNGVAYGPRYGFTAPMVRSVEGRITFENDESNKANC